MHRLRQARTLARLVLAWFALTLGVALAAPAVQPQVLQMVCTGTGVMKMVAVQDGGAVQQSPSHTLDCSLCTPAAPPPAVVQAGTQAQPLAHAVQPIPSARHAARVAAPLPARGPPLLA